MSPPLFVICMNNLDSYLPPSVKYADDIPTTKLLPGLVHFWNSSWSFPEGPGRDVVPGEATFLCR